MIPQRCLTEGLRVISINECLVFGVAGTLYREHAAMSGIQYAGRWDGQDNLRPLFGSEHNGDYCFWWLPKASMCIVLEEVI